MPGAHVVDVNEANFQKEVIDFSMTAPVVVDLWATWCGPCKTLGPVLEKLADEHGGAFRLAKIDVDRSPMLAQAFRAQSIPTVVALYQGQPVDAFQGALPEQHVRQWLQGVFETTGAPSSGAGGAEEEEPVPTDPAEAEAFWRAKLAEDEADGKAALELGKLLLGRGEEDEAKSVLGGIKAAAPEFGAAQTVLALQGLLTHVAEAGGEAAARDKLGSQPDDPEARFVVAVADGVQGRFVKSLTVLVDLVGSAPAEIRDKAKAVAGTIFEAAGRDDEEIEQLRRKMARLLF